MNVSVNNDTFSIFNRIPVGAANVLTFRTRHLKLTGGSVVCDITKS